MYRFLDRAISSTYAIGMWNPFRRSKETVTSTPLAKPDIAEKPRQEVTERVRAARRTYEELLREDGLEKSRIARRRRVTSDTIREVQPDVLGKLAQTVEARRQRENIDVGTSPANTIHSMGAAAEAYILAEATRIAHSLGASRPSVDHVDLAVTNFVVETLAELETQKQVA